MAGSGSMAGAAAYVERRVARDGGDLYVRDHPGAGPAFVLMHGFPDNLRIHDSLAARLAGQGRRVISFDFLGYGQSDKPEGFACTAQTAEKDLDAVVAAMALEQVIPVAHDASGPTAINWSIDHPDRVAALALMNAYYDATPALRFPELISLFSDPQYYDLSLDILTDAERFTWLLGFQARQFLKDAPPDLQGRAQGVLVPIIAAQFRASPSAGRAFVSWTRDLPASLAHNAQRLARLAAFEAPVGLIWGAGDPYLGLGVAQALGSHFPSAKITALEAGHWPQIDSPNEVAKALLAL